MKCPNPKCSNNALEEGTHDFCFKCGFRLRGDEQTAPSPPNSQLEDVAISDPTDEVDIFYDKPQPSPDESEGQRKRKVEGTEEKPAKRKSLGSGGGSDQSDPADATVNALQSLALEKKPEELQQQTGPDAGARQEVRDKESSSDNMSDPNPEATIDHQPEGTVHNDQQTEEILNSNAAFRESSKQEVGGACELVLPLKAADSSDTCVTSMEDDLVCAKQDDGQGTSQSVDDNSSQSEQHKEDDHRNKSVSLESDNDDENESDSEEDNSTPKVGKAGATSKKTFLSKSQKKREKKKERKKKKEEREAVQKKNGKEWK